MIRDLREYRRWTWNCYRDSMCKHVFSWHLRNAAYDDICPPLARFKYDCYSAQGKMGDLARALIEGEMDWNERLLEVVYRDPVCGACSYNCGRITEMQPSDVIQAMRADAVRKGHRPPGGFGDLLATMKRYMNPYQKLDSERTLWLRGIDPSLVGSLTARQGRTKTLLYVGCFPLRDAAGEKIARDAATLLLKGGMDVGVLGERERCCGNPSLRLGDVDGFVAFAKENIKQFHEMGVETLVTICPFCYSTFVRDYPGVAEMNFKVVHILPLVLDLIVQGRLTPRRPLDMTVTWHDPCHLVRLGGAGISGTDDFQGIYREPRQILKSIPKINFVEMYRIKHDAWCCGAGSWQRNGDPEMALWTAAERCREAEAVGSSAIVTYCPHCEENLSEAAAGRESGIKVYNLLDMLLRSL